MPAWLRTHGRVCDMVFVDGDHSTAGSAVDMMHMKSATRHGMYAVADDISARAQDQLAKTHD